MWLWIWAVLGCGQSSVPSSEPAPEKAAANEERAPASSRLSCNDDPACTAAEARLRVIDIVLRRDCNVGGAADPEECEAEQGRLRKERAEIVSRYGGSSERAARGGGPGGGGEEVEGMEIDVDDE